MSAQQPEALRLADELLALHGPTDIDERAAAELRRLHAANLDCIAWYEAAKAERDDLLEALRSLHAAMACYDGTPEETLALDAARAAIAKATGEAA